MHATPSRLRRYVRTENKTMTRFETIAKKRLDIPTLEERKSDALDFHEVSVWALKAALADAYALGVQDSHEEHAKIQAKLEREQVTSAELSNDIDTLECELRNATKEN